jgi:small-conductance mechanosensitive channel
MVDRLISYEEENRILGLFDNPLPKPLDTPIGAFILNVILWVFIAFALYYFIKIVLIGIARKTKTLFDDRLIEIVRRPFLFIIILYGAIQSVFKLHFIVGLQIYILQISIFIFFILGIYIIYRVYNESLEAWAQRKGGDESMFGAVIKPIMKKIGITIILVGGFIVALNATGIEVTALLAGAGIMGIVIAFAAQDTLSNFFSGIHLLLDRPFKIGDVIYLEPGNYWRVLNVGLRSTRLYSIFDHELVIMPNNSVANQKIINVVKPDATIRKKIKVSVAYGTDLKKVMKILLDIAHKHPHVVKEKKFEPLVRITDFGDSGIEFTMNMWIDEVLNQWVVLSEIRLEIDERFKKEKITIPFPQRTLWINQKDKSLLSKNEENEVEDKKK